MAVLIIGAQQSLKWGYLKSHEFCVWVLNMPELSEVSYIQSTVCADIHSTVRQSMSPACRKSYTMPTLNPKPKALNPKHCGLGRKESVSEFIGFHNCKFHYLLAYTMLPSVAPELKQTRQHNWDAKAYINPTPPTPPTHSPAL